MPELQGSRPPSVAVTGSTLPQLGTPPGSRSQPRPASKGLAALTISGTAPPSRHGTASPGTAPPASALGSRGRSSGLSRSLDGPLSSVVQKLILRMRVRFGDAAADVKGQEIISAEVSDYVNQHGTSIKTEDVMEVEKRIRARLTGGTPMKLTMSLEKRARADGDEWAKMFQYNIQIGLAQEKAEAELARQRQLLLKQDLDKMIRHQEDVKRQEAEEAVAYFRNEQAALRDWEAQEEQKRQLQASIMVKLKQERVEQLKEKEQRKQKLLEQVRADEADLAARIAYSARAELEKEEQERTLAKTQLVEYLSGNELNKHLREEEKRKQAAEDAMYKRLWEEKLNKQEADRLKLLEKTKIRQSIQAQMAASREECKRWLDQDIIDRYYREREEARDREEQERQARVQQGAIVAVRTLETQIKEREQAKAEERAREQENARMVLDQVAAAHAKEEERKRQLAESKLKFKAELEAQMKANAHRRRVAPMTDMERKINTKMLENVYEWQITGKLPEEATAPRQTFGAPPRKLPAVAS